MTRLKAIILSAIFLFLINSCGVFFYNYRHYLDARFIYKSKADTSDIAKISQMIYDLAGKENFYKKFINDKKDSLHFYGPDYHTFVFKIKVVNDSVDVNLHYFGYNGSKRNPPHGAFIKSVKDSLVNHYSARQIIYRDLSNEKKK